MLPAPRVLLRSFTFLVCLMATQPGLAAPIYQLKMVARPATQSPTEGQKGSVLWTVTNISTDAANPAALLPIQLLTPPPGAAQATPKYANKIDPNNEVYDLQIVDPTLLDGKTLNKNELVTFTQTFKTRDKRSPAPFLNTVGIWNLSTTMNWKPVATGTNSKSNSSASVYVTDPKIATDISGGTTFTTPTAPASGTGTKAADYISYGWSFNVSKKGYVSALGFWDEGPAGLASDHTVSLWSAAGGAPLATVTVQSDSPGYVSQSSAGSWVFVTLDEQLTLPAGDYVLGADYISASPDLLRISSPSSPLTLYTHPDVTFTASRQSSTWASGLQFPDQLILGEVGRFGPNLLFWDKDSAWATIPEPATWLLGLLAAPALCLHRVTRTRSRASFR